MSINLVSLQTLSGHYHSLLEAVLTYVVEIIRSPQFSHSMSLLFIGMVLIMLIQTCDSKIGTPLPQVKATKTETESKNGFSTPPAKQVNLFYFSKLAYFVQSGRNINRQITHNIAPRSNALLADRSHTPGTPYSTVSTLTPDSNYKTIKVKHDNFEEEDANSDDVSCAPSEGTTLSGFSRIDFLLYENEIMKSSVHDPKVLIGWRIFVKGRGNGVVLSTKKAKFSSTKFQVQFDNGTIEYLSLKRSHHKGKVPFSLISNGSVAHSN